MRCSLDLKPPSCKLKIPGTPIVIAFKPGTFFGKLYLWNVIVKNNFSQISPSASENSTESRACGSTVMKMNGVHLPKSLPILGLIHYPGERRDLSGEGRPEA